VPLATAAPPVTARTAPSAMAAVLRVLVRIVLMSGLLADFRSGIQGG
jgi:hypothetical protein